MKKVLYLLLPIGIGILMFFVSANIIFKVPDPSGIGYAPITFKVAWIVAIISFIVSSIVSVIMYMQSKNVDN